METGTLSPIEVAQAIKTDLRSVRRISIADAAEQIGKPAQSLYNIMKGRSRISHRMAELLHEHFGYSVPFLTQGSGSLNQQDEPKTNTQGDFPHPRKVFNITGSCNPQKHYMVDMGKRFEAVRKLIDNGQYFTINRARQYGKTTLLDSIWRNLSDQYIVILLSFEGVGDTAFSSESAFVKMFIRQMSRFLNMAVKSPSLAEVWSEEKTDTLDGLSDLVIRFTMTAPKPVVLGIDEVDKSSDNQLFLNFLGMLRNKYLERNTLGMESTFLSVILAGVHDIKNLKIKMRPDSERKYNSPWNIAADFNVDMTFQPEEIAQMLGDYEADVHTGMDVDTVSEEIYRYTSGYPFLVSYICHIIDEELERNWTSEGVKQAVKRILSGYNTLTDDLSKNLENNPELRRFLYNISVNGAEYAFAPVNPMVSIASMFSYIKNVNGRVRIHNAIFEEALYYYFTIAYQLENSDKLSPFQLNYIVNGRLNMEYALDRFSAMMHQEYRVKDGEFLERQGRLVFLSFLKPIINGTGFYYVEPQTRNNKRMDIVVNYGPDEFVIELKLWYGEKYERTGREQLAEYLSIRGHEKGYLIIFDFTKEKKAQSPRWIEQDGKQIFEVII